MVEAEQTEEFPLPTGCMKPRLKWENKPKPSMVPATKSQPAAANSTTGEKSDGKNAGQNRNRQGPRRVGGGQAQANQPVATANNPPVASQGSSDKSASIAAATTSNTAAPRSKPKGPIICYNCRKEGHISQNCPEPKKTVEPAVSGPDADSRRARKKAKWADPEHTGEVGAYRSLFGDLTEDKVPLIRIKLAGKTVQVLLDPGASGCIIAYGLCNRLRAY